jgi:alkyl hydroperoxide reductase subunit AhpC
MSRLLGLGQRFPDDFTFVCPTQLVEFNRALREFRALSARVFGVSADSHHAHLAWRKENSALRNLEFPMLADADRRSRKSWGFWILSRRSRFGRPTCSTGTGGFAGSA